MTLPSVDAIARVFWTGWADAALRALALAVVVGLAISVLRVRSAAVRLCVWTVVVAATLLMPAISRVTPALRVPVLPAPVIAPLPAPPGEPAATPTRMAGPEPRFARAAMAPMASPLPPTQAPIQPAGRSLSWLAVAALIYAGGVGVLLLRMAVGWRVARRLERGACAIDDSDALAGLEARARPLGISTTRLPRLLETPKLFVPLTMGIARPSILLPAGWRDWSPATFDAVLTHELSHVARRDALTQWISLLCRAIYWCTPLTWWLHRHLVNLGEQASDDAALAAGADRAAYAETLVAFFTAIQGHPRRAAWTVAMASGASVERRVERVLRWKGAGAARITTAVALSAVFGGATLSVLSAAVMPVRVSAPPVASIAVPTPRTPAASVATPSDDSARVVAPPSHWPETTVVVPAMAAAMPAPPLVQPTPPPAVPQSSGWNLPGVHVMEVLLDLSAADPTQRLHAIDITARNVGAALTRMSAGLDIARVWRISTVGQSVTVVQDFTTDGDKVAAALQALAMSASVPVESSARLAAVRTECTALSAMPADDAFYQDADAIRRRIEIGTMAPIDMDSRYRSLIHVIAGPPLAADTMGALSASCQKPNLAYSANYVPSPPAQTTAPPPAAAPSESQRLIAMVFDPDTLPGDDLRRAVDDAAAFVNKDMRAGDSAAVLAFGTSLQMLQEFTQNTSFLLSALARTRVASPGGLDTQSKSEAIRLICNEMATSRTRSESLAARGLMRGPVVETSVFYYSTGLDRGITSRLSVDALRAACRPAGVNFVNRSLTGGSPTGAAGLNELLIADQLRLLGGVIAPLSPAPPPPMAITLTLASHQSGSPVTLTTTSGVLDSGYASVTIRNDSAKPIRAVTLGAVIRRGEAMDRSSAASAPRASVTLPPGDKLDISTRLLDGTALNALALHGGAAELGVIEIEFADGTKWTYDLAAKGQFDK